MEHLKHNADVLQAAMPKNCKMMAVVKAQGYGHGVIAMSVYLNRIGINAFAVATIDEGIELRQNGIQGEILILDYTCPDRAKELYRHDLIQTLIDYNYSVLLNQQGYQIKAHIKIDTGMHRLGFDSGDISRVLSVFQAKNLHICGIYTHLCTSQSFNTKDIEFTHLQIKRFYELVAALSKQGIRVPKTHIQSSYGLLNYPELQCDYVRIGIALYGASTTENDKTKLDLNLYPVLSLKSRIILIKEIKKGESVGYNRGFIADRDRRIALIPVGYADGLPRSLSCGNGNVLIRGCHAPIAGQICMDQLNVDITDIPDSSVGDIVTLIGEDGKSELCSGELAENADTITNEILSRMGNRLKLIYH